MAFPCATVRNPTFDANGNPRVFGERIDIGAYDFQGDCEGADFDDDGIPDLCDKDIDDDGITNSFDDCDYTPAGTIINSDGRPRADLNLDCVVNLADFGIFQNDIE